MLCCCYLYAVPFTMPSSFASKAPSGLCKRECFGMHALIHSRSSVRGALHMCSAVLGRKGQAHVGADQAVGRGCQAMQRRLRLWLREASILLACFLQLCTGRRSEIHAKQHALCSRHWRLSSVHKGNAKLLVQHGTGTTSRWTTEAQTLPDVDTQHVSALFSCWTCLHCSTKPSHLAYRQAPGPQLAVCSCAEQQGQGVWAGRKAPGQACHGQRADAGLSADSMVRRCQPCGRREGRALPRAHGAHILSHRHEQGDGTCIQRSAL